MENKTAKEWKLIDADNNVFYLEKVEFDGGVKTETYCAEFLHEQDAKEVLEALNASLQCAEMKKRIEELEAALKEIADWKLPATGKFWDDTCKNPVSYEAQYGSNGVRDYIKLLANNALKIPHDTINKP